MEWPSLQQENEEANEERWSSSSSLCRPRRWLHPQEGSRETWSTRASIDGDWCFTWWWTQHAPHEWSLLRSSSLCFWWEAWNHLGWSKLSVSKHTPTCADPWMATGSKASEKLGRWRIWKVWSLSKWEDHGSRGWHHHDANGGALLV